MEPTVTKISAVGLWRYGDGPIEPEEGATLLFVVAISFSRTSIVHMSEMAKAFERLWEH